jgi:cytochrome c-type biogenesis protein CcmE
MTVVVNAAIPSEVYGKVWPTAALLLSLLACERSKPMRQLPVDDLVEKQASFEHETVRATGTLVPGSLHRQTEPCETELALRHGGTVLPVRYRQCVVPEALRDVPGIDVEVVAEGVLAADGHFDARAVSVPVPDLLSPYGSGAPSSSSK